jgi:hypothetical protein
MAHCIRQLKAETKFINHVAEGQESILGALKQDK